VSAASVENEPSVPDTMWLWDAGDDGLFLRKEEL
jgi:hypothetical protein